MSMTVRNFTRTLDRTKSVQKLTQTPTTPPSHVREVDWERRTEQKYRLFVKHIKILCVLVLFSLVGLILPLWIISPDIGKSVFISLPPMLFITLSWMVPAWLFLYDKALLLSTTLGAIPLRVVLTVAFSYIIWTYVPNIIFSVFVIGMVWHWSLFSISEISMLHRFCKIK